jgi:hypothetical protein
MPIAKQQGRLCANKSIALYCACVFVVDLDTTAIVRINNFHL